MGLFMVKFERLIFSLLILLLPTQFGKHFWPDFTIVSGIRIDYLSPTVYVTDLLLLLLIIFFLLRKIKKFRIKHVINKKQGFLFGAVVLFALCNVMLSTRLLLS